MFFPRMNAVRRNATFSNPMAMFNRVMTDAFDSFVRPVAAAPAFNMWADDNGAVLTSELPGIGLDNLEITVSGKQVTVSGERKEEAQEGRFVRRERAAASFQRSFSLPFAVDAGKVEAKLANGVLEIALPRAENDKPRKIAIRAE
ncbi:MAG: Hsp20/alpha crystallin family protein [Planctomycetaceae bacterium]|nr:Hsp20/alpha crystallin family protein [Planctomycetaceae bacterium]